LQMAEEAIHAEYGNKYHKARRYKTKSSGAQEAHEAIRPTDFGERKASSDSREQKLYDLIWKRTLASQMSDAEIEKTVATIQISTSARKLVATGEVLKFDGFLKLYMESKDEDESEENEDEDSKGVLPPLKQGQGLDLKQMV